MGDYHQELNSYRKRADNTPMTVGSKRGYLTFVKTFVEKLHTKGLLDTNTPEHIELPKAVFTQKEIQKILDQTLLFGFYQLCNQ